MSSVCIKMMWQEARTVPAEALAPSVAEGTVWNLSRRQPYSALELGSPFFIRANCVILSLTELTLAEYLLGTNRVQVLSTASLLQ